MTFGNYIYQDGVSQSRQKAIDTLINVSDKLQAGHLETVSAASQLKTAIGSLDFNEKDAWLKDELLQKFEKTINDNIQYGNLSYAADDLVTLQGNIFSDPRVTGRLKSQQAHKAFIDYTNKRTDITEDEKEWLRELNPYHYEDNITEDGRILEGKIWTPNKNLGSDVDLSTLMIKAINNVAHKKIRSGEKIVYKDAQGNVVDIKNNPGEVAGASIMEENGIEREWLSKEDIKGAIDAMINTTPGAKEYIRNQWNLALWYHNKHKNDEGYNDPYGITYKDEELSFDDYKWSLFNQGIDAASYEYVKTTTSQKIMTPTYTKNNGSGYDTDIDNIVGGIYGIGRPTQEKIDLQQQYKQTENNAISNLTSIASQLGLNGFVIDENNPSLSFDNAINGIKNNLYSNVYTTEESKNNAINAIKSIKRLQEDYNLAKENENNLKNPRALGLTGSKAEDYSQASSFINDFNEGKLDTTNKYYKSFVDKYNEIFKGDDGKSVESKTISLEPDRARKCQQWCKDNDIDLTDFGISFSGNNIIVPKNKQAAMAVGKMLNENPSYYIGDTYRLYETNPAVSKVYPNGSPVGQGNLLAAYNQQYDGTYDTGNDFASLFDVNKKAIKTLDKYNKNLNNGVEVVRQSYILPNPDWTNVGEGIPVSEAKSTYDESLKRIYDMPIDLTQYTMFTFDKKDENRLGNLVKIENADERNEYNNSFRFAQQNKKLVPHPMLHNGYGVTSYIVFPEYKDGKETNNMLTMVVPDAFKSDASEKFNNEPDVKAAMTVGNCKDIRNTSAYAIRESDLPTLGTMIIHSDDNANIILKYQGKDYYIDDTSAREITSFGLQVEDIKNIINSDKLNEQSLNNILQSINRISIIIGANTNTHPDFIANKIAQDLGLTE